jgi:N-acetyl sugar amidotransferase
MKMQFCKRCLYSTDHPLGLTINNEGICSGCIVHEEKDNLDWKERWDRLESIVKQYRLASSVAKYDCIVPVSGANDSYFILHLVKEKLKLNPLVVCYNKYYNTPIGIKNLANLRIKFNCDIFIQNVNPNSVKKIIRTTLREFGSVYWPNLAGQSVFPVQVAVNMKIPLIIWGAHQGLEQVGMFSHKHQVEMTRRYRKDHDLMGVEADDLLSKFDTLKESDIWKYRYPEDADLNSIGVRGIYLGNYVRWDPKAQHEKMIKMYNYRSANSSRTFDSYDFIDCYNYLHLHDLLKLYKHGYSKVTDHACREIRHGRISRQYAIELVRKYETKRINHLSLFLDYLSLPKRSLDLIINFHRNKKYWKEVQPGKWKFNGLSKQLKSKKRKNHSSNFEGSFKATDKIELKSKNNYITIGKGWP